MKKILLVLLALIMLTCVCSCKSSKEPAPVTADTGNIEASGDTTEDMSDKFYVSDADVYGIDTPYGVIYYPTKWSDMVVTEITENDTAYSIKFSAQLDGKSIPLYSVVFGEYNGDSISSGTLTVGEHKDVRVYFVDHSAEGMEAGLTGEHETAYLTMCEDINVIISKLIYTSGMELD